MSTETLDSTLKPSAFEFVQVFNDEEFRDAAGGVWGQGRTGNRWQLMLTYTNRSGAARRLLWAHIGELRGKQNRLRVPLSRLSYSRTGSGGGTPLIVGAHTAGATSLSIDGASGSTDWLVGGDFITIGNELKMVTGDVDLTAGAGTIKIWPELHGDHADNTPVDVATPHGDFFLLDAQGLGAVAALVTDSDWLSPSLTITLEEDVYA